MPLSVIDSVAVQLWPLSILRHVLEYLLYLEYCTFIQTIDCSCVADVYRQDGRLLRSSTLINIKNNNNTTDKNAIRIRTCLEVVKFPRGKRSQLVFGGLRGKVFFPIVESLLKVNGSVFEKVHLWGSFSVVFSFSAGWSISARTGHKAQRCTLVPLGQWSGERVEEGL